MRTVRAPKATLLKLAMAGSPGLGVEALALSVSLASGARRPLAPCTARSSRDVLRVQPVDGWTKCEPKFGALRTGAGRGGLLHGRRGFTPPTWQTFPCGAMIAPGSPRTGSRLPEVEAGTRPLSSAVIRRRVAQPLLRRAALGQPVLRRRGTLTTSTEPARRADTRSRRGMTTATMTATTSQRRARGRGIARRRVRSACAREGPAGAEGSYPRRLRARGAHVRAGRGVFPKSWTGSSSATRHMPSWGRPRAVWTTATEGTRQLRRSDAAMRCTRSMAT